MSSASPTIGRGGAVQSFGRLLWLSHGLLIIVAVASFQIASQLAAADPAPDIRPRIIDDAAIAAGRTGPSTDVRPLGFIVCTQREVREARSEIPPWTSGYIALQGVTPQADIERLIAMGAAGEIDLINYDC